MDNFLQLSFKDQMHYYGQMRIIPRDRLLDWELDLVEAIDDYNPYAIRRLNEQLKPFYINYLNNKIT